MLDHMILTVSNVERSLAFYEAALKPLNIKFFLPRAKAIILICGDLAMARGRSSGSGKGSLIQRPFTGGSWPKTMVRSMNSTGRQYPLVPGTIFHRGHDWNTIRDTMPPIYLTRTGIHSRSSIKALGDDAQIAKSGELPPKALVCVDAIREACLTNLDGALDCLFTEVEHPVHERPVCNLIVWRGMQAIAGNY